MSGTDGRSPSPSGVSIAAGAYIVTAAFGMRVAVREGLGAEPVGIRMGSASPRDALLTNGTALSAPPAMLVALASNLPGSRRGRRRSLAVLAGLGAAFVSGMLAEPVTAEVLAAPTDHPERTAVVVANVLIPAAMAVLALRELARG